MQPQKISASTQTACSHQAVIEKNEAQVSLVESDVDYLEALLEEVRARREDLLGIIALHRSYLAPVAKMPVEILNMVFFELVDCSPIYERHFLALVCRHWRDVLNCTPSLWRKIHFSWGPRMPTIDAAELHVERARQLALDIDIDVTRLVGDYYFDEEVEYWYHIVKKHPWRSLKISSSNNLESLEDLYPFLIDGLSNATNVKGLQEFSLGISHDDGKFDLEGLLKSDALASLELPARINLSPSHPVLRHIRILSITRCGMPAFHPDLLSIVQECPLLESLTFDTKIPESTPSITPFTLSNLRHLSISDLMLPTAFFKTLRAPSLESLELKTILFTRDEKLTEFIRDFIDPLPSGAAYLKKLVLYCVSCPGRTLIWLIERAPKLESLTITYTTKKSTKLFELLTKEATVRRAWFAPTLKFLEFTGCHLTVGMLRNLVRVRVRDVPTKIRTKKQHRKLMPPVPLESILVGGQDMIKKYNS